VWDSRVGVAGAQRAAGAGVAGGHVRGDDPPRAG
jgi:hypothetical protein